MKAILSLLLLMLAATTGMARSANISGDVRGVTLFYLDGPSQDFPWILDHQYDPTVRAKLDKLLEQYRQSDVNWIRLLVVTNHFPDRSAIHPVPSAALIKKLNDFMAITRAGANGGQFHIELMLIPEQNGPYFTDQAPYTRDKLWYRTWLTGLNYTNLGIVMLGGDLAPCDINKCHGDSGAGPVAQNHGSWIEAIWQWRDANFPNVNASYEVIGVPSNNDPKLIRKLGIWSKTRTPTNPIFAASIYVALPPGSSWQAYADTTAKILDAHASSGAKPLWIDEYGKAVGASVGTVADQDNAFSGFLGASICWRQNRYPKFAWVAGNDASLPTSYGLLSGFSGTMPVFRPAWDAIAVYYGLTACP